MLGILFAHVFDSKVIYYKGEHDWSGFMSEETVGVFCWVVAVLCQMQDETVVG